MEAATDPTDDQLDALDVHTGWCGPDARLRHDPLTCEWCLAPIPGPDEEENA